MRIAIDFISTCKIVDGIAKYTGGTNYAKQRILFLKEQCFMSGHNILLLVQNEFKVSEKEEKELFENIEFVYANDLTQVDYSKFDILYMPQVNGTTLLKIPSIKKKNGSLKIIATLHDRQHNVTKFDKYDRYYCSGIKRFLIVSLGYYILKKATFNCFYNHCVKYIDKIITVSNYSMQKLNYNVSSIKYYLNNKIFFRDNISIERGDYCLFVGGNRPEKNLIRTLEAFCFFKKEMKSYTKMIVTGINNEFKRVIQNKKFLNQSIIEKDVVFIDYVSMDELARLYAKSRYVVFTSKCEGYGLPVKEALSYGKPVMASNVTSIPEVAGAVAYYVNPFDIQSIKKGFIFFENQSVLSHYELAAQKRYRILEKISELDDEEFFFDFIN